MSRTSAATVVTQKAAPDKRAAFAFDENLKQTMVFWRPAI
jgi:hypothetical protein